MKDKIPQPALLDGEIAASVAQLQLPSDLCPEQWLLEHPEEIHRLAVRYIEAGCQIICTPTATADRHHLERYGLGGQTAQINQKLAQLTVQTVESIGKPVFVAGCVSPLDLHAQPFGETPFLEIVNIYAEQAFALKRGGANFLLADRMTSLSHCRAALLGCKQTRLPVMVVLEVEPDGETNLGCDLVSALIVCQSLGASAFGLTCRGTPHVLLRHVEEMAPYSTIPLIVKPDAVGMTPTDWSKSMLELWESGAVLLGGGQGATPEHMQAVAQEMQRFDFRKIRLPLDTDTIFMAGETEPYFLDEFFQQSEPIACSYDMADELLEAETAEANVITIQIDTTEDAYNFAENAHMLHKPVSFLSDSEEALEMALLMFNGRAFVDSRSRMEETALYTIAEGYGAIVR